MNRAKDHYDRQLANIYNWMSGSPEVHCQIHPHLIPNTANIYNWMSGSPEAAIKRNYELFQLLEANSAALLNLLAEEITFS